MAIYPTIESVKRAKANAEKYRINVMKELESVNQKISALDVQASDCATKADFDSFDRITDEICRLKSKQKFYEEHLALYNGGEFPQISTADVCESWNEIEKSLEKKLDKSFELVEKARSEFIRAIESYASVVADALKVYYAYRNELPSSAFNRLGEPIYQFVELPKHSYSKIADITGFIYNSDLIKHRYLTRILNRGIYWED